MNISWNGTLTATSSISHAGITKGTQTVLRREKIITADGHVAEVPIVSGNTIRGRLRRIGEELLRDALDYQGQLPLAAAHALRGGGALAKTSGEPLSGSRLADLRQLIPQLGVFGAATSGTIIDGALEVGKAIPHLTETAHITGLTSPPHTTVFTATQLEEYTRQDDGDRHDFVPALNAPTSPQLDPTDGSPVLPDPTLEHDAPGPQMRFLIETFPIGTTFSWWTRLRRPTDLEHAFFTEVLEVFTRTGRIGGRTGIGHGMVRADLTCDADAAPNADWRTHLTDHRDTAVHLLKDLT